MRGLGMFFGRVSRNDPIKLTDPRPIANYGNDVESGDAGKDGFSVLAKATPGRPSPLVSGAEGQVFRGPSQGWEE